MVPFCALRDELVFEVCDAFAYEPGTDASDRESSPRLRGAGLGQAHPRETGERAGRVLADVEGRDSAASGQGSGAQAQCGRAGDAA